MQVPNVYFGGILHLEHTPAMQACVPVAPSTFLLPDDGVYLLILSAHDAFNLFRSGCCHLLAELDSSYPDHPLAVSLKTSRAQRRSGRALRD